MIRYLLLILSVILLILFYKINLPTFRASEDMAFQNQYLKKPLVSQNDDFFTSFIRYTDSSKKLLTSVNEESLIALRCSDNILRTNQGAYILKNAKTEKTYRRTIKNTDFIKFMRNKEYSLPHRKKILTVKICETDNNTVISFYSIGEYDSKNVDNNTILQTIHDSTNNEAFVEIISNGFFPKAQLFKIAQSKVHIICDEPFYLTKGKMLSILCNEEFSNLSSYLIYEVNLNTGNSKLLKKCSNKHGLKIQTICD